MSPLWWAFLLFGLGMLLLAVDVIVPSGGALAILAIFSFVVSVGVSFMESTLAGVLVLVSETVFLLVLVSLFVKWWPHSPLGKRILIQRSRLPMVEGREEPESAGLTALVGMVGLAKSKLLPAGSIVLKGRRYDAVSDGSAIEAGQAVEVVSVEMNKIVVRASDRPLTKAVNSSDGQIGDDLLSRPIEELGLESFEDPLS